MQAHELPRLGMGTWSGNHRMIRLAARVGMRQEACFLQARLVDGRRYDGVYFFEEFVIAESRRGQGVGSRFLAALEDDLRASGERDVFLSMVWPGYVGAIDFYRRHGYNLLNTFELRKGLDRDRRGREIRFLGRRFHLADSVRLVGW